MQTAPLTPERILSQPLDWLMIMLERRRIKSQGTWITQLLVMLIQTRITNSRQRFYRLVERIRAGEFRPRKPAAPRPAATQASAPPPDKPRRRPPKPGDPMFKKSGWMLRLMPGPEAGHSQLALQTMLADPEMAPVLAAAPGPLWRELRPLCFMFAVRRPAILAPPPRPRRPKRKARKAAKAKRRQAAKPTKPFSIFTDAELVYSYSAHWPKGVPGKPKTA